MLSGFDFIHFHESTRQPDEPNFRYFQSFLLAQSEKLKPLHIVEGTFFAKSHTSNLIQVADVCTNVFYRKIARDEEGPECKAIHRRFWRHDGRLQGCGIKKWP